MRKAVQLFVACALVILPGTSVAVENFDGTWHTKLTCPPKRGTEGYTWNFDSVILNNNLRGSRGTEGEPGSFVLEGKVAPDGTAKLSGSGIILSRKYARGVFAHKGEEYSYEVKAQFKETEGTGTRDEGLGIVGRPCTFEFVKQQAAPQTGGH
jgi:hypothetical protein